MSYPQQNSWRKVLAQFIWPEWKAAIMGMAEEQAEREKLWAERVNSLSRSFAAEHEKWVIERASMVGTVDDQGEK